MVITPELSDQPFYAEMVTRLGLGAATPPGLDNLQTETLTSAVDTALSEAVVKNVQDFGEHERSAVSPITLVARTLAEIVEDARNRSNAYCSVNYHLRLQLGSVVNLFLICYAQTSSRISADAHVKV